MFSRIPLSMIAVLLYILISMQYNESGTTTDAGLLEILLSYFVSSMFIMAVHEAGHALAAKALKFNLYFVSLGTGPRLFEINRRNLTISFHLYPFQGMTAAAPATEEKLRLRLGIFYAAGLFVNFILMAVAWAFVGSQCFVEMLLSHCSHHPSFIELFIVINFIIILLNLVPSQANLSLGKFSNDGLRLFKLLFSDDPKTLSEPLAYDYAFRGLQLRRNKKLKESIAVYEEGIKRYPECFACYNDLGIVYLDQGEFEKARKLFTTLLDKQQKDDSYKNLLYNNIAWTDLFLGEGFLKEADKFSEKSLRSAPKHPSFLGTRGAVLVRTDRPLEGIKLLEKALHKNPANESRAENACWLAIGYAKLGEIQVAQNYLSKAKNWNPDCVPIKLVEEELEKALNSKNEK